jgi:hypothetical protein
VVRFGEGDDSAVNNRLDSVNVDLGVDFSVDFGVDFGVDPGVLVLRMMSRTFCSSDFVSGRGPRGFDRGVDSVGFDRGVASLGFGLDGVIGLEIVLVGV